MNLSIIRVELNCRFPVVSISIQSTIALKSSSKRLVFQVMSHFAKNSSCVFGLAKPSLVKGQHGGNSE